MLKSIGVSDQNAVQTIMKEYGIGLQQVRNILREV